jgi:hypothetical protein
MWSNQRKRQGIIFSVIGSLDIIISIIIMIVTKSLFLLGLMFIGVIFLILGISFLTCCSTFNNRTTHTTTVVVEPPPRVVEVQTQPQVVIVQNQTQPPPNFIYCANCENPINIAMETACNRCGSVVQFQPQPM